MRTTLLTGATGLLGRFLLREALMAEVPVAVLVRSRGARRARERIETLTRALEQEAGRSLAVPRVLDGCLNEPGLALAPSDRVWLKKNTVRVIHAAASLAFEDNPKTGEPERTNVDGTRNLAALCSEAGIEEFHHVSTAYVCGKEEDIAFEASVSEKGRFHNAYERSKAKAENLVRSAGFERCTIYRPSIIVGDSETSFTSSSFGFYAPLRAWRLFEQLSESASEAAHAAVSNSAITAPPLQQLGIHGDEEKNLVPVDWVARAIFEVASAPSRQGGILHLTHPQPVRAKDIYAAFAEALAQVPPPSALSADAAKQRALQAKTTARWTERLAVYRTYFRSDPTFDRTRAQQVIETACPPVDHELMVRLAVWALERDFGDLPARPHAAPLLAKQEQLPAVSGEGSVGSVRSVHEQRHPASTDDPPLGPIAVIGMACRLPGASNLAEYWRLLREGTSAIGELPADLLDRDLYYSAQRGALGKTYTTLGGLVSERSHPLADAALAPEQRADADPAHLLFLEIALQACGAAGKPISGGTNSQDVRGGVWIGHAIGSSLAGRIAMRTQADEVASLLHDVGPFQDLEAAARQGLAAALAERLRAGRESLNQHGGPLLAASDLTSLVSRTLRWCGPSLAVEAACSSSLAALHLACLALDRGAVDCALVGGSSSASVDNLLLFSKARSASATGSRPFDEDADGLISSEGHVALVLQTLDRARAEGREILGVIRGIGLSSDGREKSLWAPSQRGQKAALERAYARGLDPARVQYLEAHATSTQLGDATELASLSEFFAPHLRAAVPIGSVKSNLGHTLETSGLASLVKVLLAMQHQEIPPTINVSRPNRQVNWQQLPFELAHEGRPWPSAPGISRVAAVSAFGIGGLNAHVVVEEELQNKLSAKDVRQEERGAPQKGAMRRRRSPAGPLAVLGRGVVLPGAFSCDALQQLLADGVSVVGPPPAERAGPRRTGARIGGYLRGYCFDWRKFTVPPKQIERANPLQFQLIDAASQALSALLAAGGCDRQRIAVVVGTSFGGEFSNELQVGLRLAEIEAALRHLLEQRSVARESASQYVAGLRERLLLRYPAVLDETGSFTSSTLASRLAKTFDLGGGAMALDAGDASSGAALTAARDLLHSGDVDLVLCAGAQRAMDTLAFESLELRGRLASRPPPAEGVAAVVLGRLPDAQRRGQSVLAILEEVESSFSQNAVNAEQSPGSLAGSTSHALLDSLVGDLGAARGLAHVVAHSVRSQRGSQDRLEIRERATGGAVNRIVVRRPAQTIAAPLEEPAARAGRILRFGARNAEQLDGALDRALADVAHSRAQAAHYAFTPEDRARLAIVEREEHHATSQALELARAAWRDAKGRAALAKQGVFACADARVNRRVAFLFPGQGSQYAGMLSRLIATDPQARRSAKRVDQVLLAAGLEPFAALTSDGARLRDEALASQLAMLCADWILARQIEHLGIVPACAAGHSFGELAAMVACGVWTLEQAVSATQERCRLIERSGSDGGLVSLRADAQAAAQLLQELSLSETELWITHRNTASQTVVGGTRAALARLQAAAQDRGMAPKPLAVPGPLHTPLLSEASKAFREALAETQFAVPIRTFFSNVTNDYQVDGDRAAHLAAQLVEPVEYVDLVDRLRRDGIEVFLEVGPGQVLTGLHRQLLEGTDCYTIACDEPPAGTALQLLRVRAQFEVLGLIATPNEQHQPIGQRAEHMATGPPIIEFDATEPRRNDRRRRAGQQGDAAEHSSAHRPSEPSESSASPLLQLLLDFVVDQTGYPREVIDLEWDLEADLGIDSIKRAQMLGELVEIANPPAAEIDLERFAEARTLSEILRGFEDLDAGPPPPAARPSGPEHASLPQESGAAEIPSQVSAPCQDRPPSPPAPEVAAATARTRRYALTTVERPPRGVRRDPELLGAALLLGENPLADALSRRLGDLGVPCHRLEVRGEMGGAARVVDQFEQLWRNEPAPHLFLTTPWDPEARSSLAESWWQQRRQEGVLAPFWLAQRWFQRVRAAGMLDQASLSAVTTLGGDFGFGAGVQAIESGALAGLLKAIAMESWVQGARGFRAKVVDTSSEDAPEQVCQAVFDELAYASLDVESSWSTGVRKVVRSSEQVLPESASPRGQEPRRGGTWVVSGGGRGITATVARELARIYDLDLHLVGTAPRPDIPVAWRGLDIEGLRRLRVEHSEEARSRGRDPVAEWRKIEKALQIDQNLRECAALGISASYHCCDLADRESLSAVLAKIRECGGGEIDGVLHGAGYGRDARFDHKRAEDVEKCLRGKVDGALALMALTQQDPLQFFVAFGSISGRFGANGHTDYSMANDLLAKCVDWYRGQRPEVAATTVHWHAWGDVGMAVRADTRQALERVGVRLMSAPDGVRHLLDELRSGAPLAEVLVTEPAYRPMVAVLSQEETQPMDAAAEFAGRPPRLALLTATRDGGSPGCLPPAVELSPEGEPFLHQHRLAGRPILPLVAGLELAVEAAVLEHPDLAQLPLRLGAIDPCQGLSFQPGLAQRVTVRTSTQEHRIRVELLADVQGRQGQVVEHDRCRLRVDIQRRHPGHPALEMPHAEADTLAASRHEVDYAATSRGLQLGPALQTLRSVRVGSQSAVGELMAGPRGELSAPHRGLDWTIPAAELDGCFYAVGVFAWQRLAPGGTVPARLDELEIFARPDPGEACTVTLRFDGWRERFAVFDFGLRGCDGRALLAARGHHVAWLDPNATLQARGAANGVATPLHAPS